MRTAFMTVLLLAWLATGLYIVRGNELAVVRRFGKTLPEAMGSGLHMDLPWPFSRVDRVNRHSVRTVSLGLPPPSSDLSGGFLRDAGMDRQSEFLTGDKNVLNLQVNIQYVVDDPAAWLFAVEDPDLALRSVSEAVLADAVARSGVDYVHPLGLNALREYVLLKLREAARQHGWGMDVEDVTIAGVYPPVEVKAAFIDVSNARAEKDRTIQEEQTRLEQAVAAATAAADQNRTLAETERGAVVAAARGSADRFGKVLAQFRAEAGRGQLSYETVRAMTLQRLYASTLEALLPRLSGKIFLDGGKPVDLTIIPRRENSP